ncbi:MAG: tetratricopeptide repeat protein [Spirochaetes bacterium]|nr:tetratricopeptide repeat protein [Spirochaetota bacterium]
MASQQYRTIFDEALKAGAQRDYAKACELLTRIAAEADNIPQVLLYLGRAQHSSGSHAQALATFAQYLEQQPQDPDAWFFMGRSFLAVQRPKEALRCIQKARQLGRNSAQTLALLGFAEMKLRRAAKAVRTLEQAHTMEPQDPAIFRAYRNALFVLAISELNHGKAESARQILDFVIKNGGDSQTARLYRAAASREIGRLADALADMQDVAENNPDDESIQLQLAVLYIANGQLQPGYAIMEQLGVQLPGDSNAPWSAEALERWRAMTAMKQGQAKAALRSALALLRAGDREPMTRVICAQANFEIGQYYKAIEHFKRAAELDPKSPAIRLALALAYWEIADYPAARHAASAAAHRGADKTDAEYLDLLCHAGEKAAPSQLLRPVQTLMRQKPGDRRLIAIYAECLYKTGRPDLAGPWFQTLVEMDPENDLARLYLISVAESINDEELEFQRYQEYLELFPDNTAIRREFIQKLVDAHEWDLALEVLEAGFPYDTGSRTNNALLAACYRNTGHFRKAAIHYRTLLVADPKNENYLLALALCLEKSGSRKLAAELLSKGAAYIGRKAEPWLAYGTILARQKKNEEACAAFSRASELAPADPRPLRKLAKLYKASGSPEMAARFEARAAALSPT